MISSTRSTWGKTAAPNPTRRKARRASRIAARKSPARTARAPTPRTRRRGSTKPRSRAEAMPAPPAAAAEALSAEMADDAEMGDAETPAEPRRPRRHGQNEPRGPDYRPFITKHDETVAAEDLCEPEELDRLRGYLDKQPSQLQGVAARRATH